ncbi:MAG TPA: FAD-dependent oxidoreductase [Chloroflexia bacterium]|nr:FAD-dependent oxidoreductase [Chloroflexia bacterium]
MPSQKVVIIGGGIAGLSAALALTEKGLQPVVLEAGQNYAGGRLGGKPGTTLPGSEWYFPAEHGIHGFWSQYRNLKALLEEHGIQPRMVLADRQEWVHGAAGKVRRVEMGRVVRRTFWPAPIHYGTLWFRPSFWRMVGWRDWLSIPAVMASLVVATGIDPLAEGKRMQGKTLADFCKGWPPAIRAFVASLARSGLSAHPEDVPLSGFIAFLRFYTLLRRDSQRFEYLVDDADTAVVAPMVAKVRQYGGEVRLGVRVSHLERVLNTEGEPSGWKVFLEDGTAEESAQVILAADAPGTRQILLNSPETKALAKSFHWPQGLETAVIRLWFAEAPPRKHEAGIISGDFTVDNFFWLHRFQASFKEWHARSGGSALEAHIYGPPDLMAEPDEVLLKRALQDFARIYPALQGKLIHHTFQRNSATHTLFAVGTMAEHLGIRTPWPGLYCCGDWVRHATPALFLERACVTGLEAANAVLENHALPIYPLKPHAKPELLARLVGRYVRFMRATVRGTATTVK